MEDSGKNNKILQFILLLSFVSSEIKYIKNRKSHFIVILIWPYLCIFPFFSLIKKKFMHRYFYQPGENGKCNWSEKEKKKDIFSLQIFLLLSNSILFMRIKTIKILNFVFEIFDSLSKYFQSYGYKSSIEIEISSSGFNWMLFWLMFIIFRNLKFKRYVS